VTVERYSVRLRPKKNTDNAQATTCGKQPTTLEFLACCDKSSRRNEILRQKRSISARNRHI